MPIRAPWWAKMLAKITFSRLPISYRRFASLGIFRHGDMEDVSYALGVFHRHSRQAGFGDNLTGKVCLELGPGDALTSALIANACGAARCYLIDSGAFANTDISVYRQQSIELRKLGLPAADLSGCRNTDDMLARVNCTYLTDGLQSLQSLPPDSVDFIWSHAVLEHVRYDEFDTSMQQLKRVMTASGAASHRVDLQDHLDHSLNNLRFPRTRWEQDWLANSGFYTNRIRFSDMLARFSAAGFSCALDNVDRWTEAPVARVKLDAEFADLPTEELCIKGFDAVLRHSG